MPKPQGKYGKVLSRGKRRERRRLKSEGKFPGKKTRVLKRLKEAAKGRERKPEAEVQKPRYNPRSWMDK